MCYCDFGHTHICNITDDVALEFFGYFLVHGVWQHVHLILHLSVAYFLLFDGLCHHENQRRCEPFSMGSQVIKHMYIHSYM